MVFGDHIKDPVVESEGPLKTYIYSEMFVYLLCTVKSLLGETNSMWMLVKSKI